MTDKKKPATPAAEQMNGASLDIAAINRAQLKALFPAVFTETRNDKGELVESVDFEKLKAELGTFTDLFESRRERYGMDWPGKKDALKLIQTPTYATLKPSREESVNFDTTENLFIEGDNLEVLKLLQKSYYGKVKMIYIDPPYNTTNDFIYPDNYSESLETYLTFAGLMDSEGRKFSTSIPNEGRLHTRWLNMLYPRLYLARNLLSEDGVIFVSIDDNEVANLKQLMDQVFGEENYLATHYIQVRFADKTLAEKNDYQKLIEQVLIYQKGQHTPRKSGDEYSVDKFCWEIKEKGTGKKMTLGGKEVTAFSPTEYEITRVPASLKALKETWATGTILKANASGKFFGTFLAPRKDIDGLGYVYRVEGIGEDGLGYRYFSGPKKASATKGKFYSGVPLDRLKEINETGSSQKTQPIPNFYDFSGSFGNCRHEGGTDFRSGKKPISFLKALVEQAVDPNAGEIILDFFAGSCSTGHAVMDLNHSDNGNRKFILVQLPEPIEENSSHNDISSLGRSRLRKVIAELGGKAEANRDLLSSTESGGPDLGFRSFSLDKSNIRRWVRLDARTSSESHISSQLELHVEHIDGGAKPEDLLFELLIKSGFTPTEKVAVQKLAGTDVYSVAEGGLLICLADKITRELIDAVAASEPLQFVCLDSAFAGNDQLKANAVQTFAARNQGRDKTSQIVFRTV